MTVNSATWLNTPPDGSQPSPPVDTRAQSLPLGELSWQDFERLILRLVRREGEVVECSVYGTPGQAQAGIDVLSTRFQEPVVRACYQCKRVSAFSAADIVAAVDRFLEGKWVEGTNEFVLCASLSLEATQVQDEIDAQRLRLLQREVVFRVWDGSAGGGISERLKAHPDLVDDFFGRAWVASFNGPIEADRLGERLNGYELAALRGRLLSLYSVLFLQHDPGLRSDTDRRFDYRDRYVTADVFESRRLENAATEHHRSNSHRERADGLEGRGRAESHDTQRSDSTIYEARRPALDWLRHHEKCVVLGDPGYGKSTMLRYLALSILQTEKLSFYELDERYVSSFPVWISFARFSAAIDRDSGTSVDDFFRRWLHQYGFEEVYPLFQRATRGGQLLLLVDGLDEATSEQSGREALDRIVTFLEANRASIICTSRPQSYAVLGVPSQWKAAALAPLSDEKIEQLAARWFDFLEPHPSRPALDDAGHASWAKTRAQSFFRAAKDSPRTLELARNPLMCQSLIQLFRFSHRLPEARVEAYRQIVDLLLSIHPAARAQAGGSGSRIAPLGLRNADLSEILIRIAWALQSEPNGVLSRLQCEKVCTEFLMNDTFGLGDPLPKARRLAGELVGQLTDHFGVLVERAPGEFNLLHLSIQEYLAAEFVARMAQDDQVVWLDRVWNSLHWRESLISWFGILGTRGDKVLSGRAIQRVLHLGQEGEWHRLRSLELRAEIATADLGLPISEARRIIAEAIQEVETSSFRELQKALAKSITLGALGTSVRGECQAALQRWLPGQSSRKRRRLLEGFRTWSPSDGLRAALVRAFQDDDGACRRAAIDAFVTVFSDRPETLLALKDLAIRHANPEVRAAALHGLLSRDEWADVALTAAESCRGTCCPELLMVVASARIRAGLHDREDLNRLWVLWRTDAVEYWLQDELIALFLRGWPGDEKLREALMQCLRSHSRILEANLPLIYLARSYPGDDEVAGEIASMLKSMRGYFHLRKGEAWAALRFGFRGDVRITEVLRQMVQRRRDEYPSIFWDPETAGAMTAIGDDAARDDLLASYAGASLRARFWIAYALFNGWEGDELVGRAFQAWLSGDVNVAAPLAAYVHRFIVDPGERRDWFLWVASATIQTREIGAVVELLRNFRDQETKSLVLPLLDSPSVWYYHRMTLQEHFAQAFPDDPRSIEILECSLREIDGPNPGHFSDAFQEHGVFSGQLLAAATTAPVDVRLAVATVLRERAADYEFVVSVTPFPFAEEDSATRASCLMARARAARSQPEFAAELIGSLMSELNSTGSDLDIRRRTSLAALLELHCYHDIVAAFEGHGETKWEGRLFDAFGTDPVSVGAIVDHWDALSPRLMECGMSTELPFSEVIRQGYEAVFDRNPSLQRELDTFYLTQTPDLITPGYLDTFGRRHPGNAKLRALLISLICSRQQGDLVCTAARVLAQCFRSENDVWAELSPFWGRPVQAREHLSDGVLGHLAIGWPEGQVSDWVRDMDASERATQSMRNRLLFTIHLQDAEEAEAAARLMITTPLESWRHRNEDSHVLWAWARWDESRPWLEQWLWGEDPSLSITAASLLAGTRRGIEEHVAPLIARFNARISCPDARVGDGLDATTGENVSWVASMYSTLNVGRHPTASTGMRALP